MLRWSSGRRPRSKIPLGPPLEKGEDSCLHAGNPTENPEGPFVKGGWGNLVYGHGFRLNTRKRVPSYMVSQGQFMIYPG